jgi:phosphoglycerate dehydrogenase-like enzyme
MRLMANQNAHLGKLLEERLRQEAPDIAVTWLDQEGEAQGPVEDVEIFFRFDVGRKALIRALQQAPNLKWMHSGSAGVDNVLPIFLEYASQDAILTNGSGTMSRPIAEYCLAQIAFTSKGLYVYPPAQQRHEWLRHYPQNNPPPAIELLGAQVLTMGLGAIGGELARLCSAVGMRVHAVRRRRAAAGEMFPGVEQIYGFDEDWRSLFPTMDYVVVTMPLTDDTRGLIGATELAAMKSTSWIINISRGAIIQEDDLVAALQSHSIGGAVLDVTAKEPLPPEHPLWDCPNAIITPHISWRSPHFGERSMALFFQNLRRYRQGEPLLNLIPRDRGY